MVVVPTTSDDATAMGLQLLPMVHDVPFIVVTPDPGNRANGTVPDANAEAFRDVRFVPTPAEGVPRFRPLGSVVENDGTPLPFADSIPLATVVTLPRVPPLLNRSAFALPDVTAVVPTLIPVDAAVIVQVAPSVQVTPFTVTDGLVSPLFGREELVTWLRLLTLNTPVLDMVRSPDGARGWAAPVPSPTQRFALGSALVPTGTPLMKSPWALIVPAPFPPPSTFWGIVSAPCGFIG